MLYQIESKASKLVVTNQFREEAASALGVREKVIEGWIASRPQLLLPNEELLVIGQSISGQGMADILALDSVGDLVLVEIKRDWSDRSTVAQLLSYAAEFHETTYARLNREAQRFKGWSGGDLITKFREFSDNDDFSKEQLGQKQGVFIVAPDSDEGLKKLAQWLSTYGVPIHFVPFKLLGDADGNLRFIDIEGVATEIEAQTGNDSWAGHWIFNTNETYGAGAYKRMFDEGVIAIYGYPNGPRNLSRGAAAGEKVFAYVNRQGIRALGTIVDASVQKSQGVFVNKDGRQQPDEYHMTVDWTTVLPEHRALSNRESSSIGYNLPIRTVFGRLHRGSLARRLEEEVLGRE